jgi:hypothetical protein
MRQQLTTDTVDRHIDASPAALYAIIADVTRTPELTPDIVRCEWLDGATDAVVGARFKATNDQGRGPNWKNSPVIVTASPGQEIAWARTEPFAGTVEWRYRFDPEDGGTRVTESYRVTKPISIVGWFIIGTLYGLKDRQRDLHNSMVATLDRLAEIATSSSTPAEATTAE